ncbi:putative ATP-dependent DNA helicase HFM1 [Leucoagaricus sp. SymC.cos]|nr:putative ATP-dependent DNA helicase HFM1 [Leucoagaricus sp. SymC.cos]
MLKGQYTPKADMFRGIFRFPSFNAMQSRCFDHASLFPSPTGSGKTVLFELAIIKLLGQPEQVHSKVVYIAPTKALCSERTRDWTAKFGPLGIRTCELTGDTVQLGRGAWGDAKKSSIMPENNGVLTEIKLFLVDEVHILNETRGSTLEVVVSRMKGRNKSMRFLLVSATVPNIHDIANWIDTNSGSGVNCGVFEFGEEYRPCKLTKFVIGVPRSPKQNEFQFATTLDAQLFPVLQQHSVMKPILIFCSTRRGTLNTAATLIKAYEEAEKRKGRLPWVRALRWYAATAVVEDSHAPMHPIELAINGIGIHHAGLGIDDRRLVEDLFLDGTLRILVATSVKCSTAAHTVVIRGVKLFQNNATIEYSDLDVMQMIGRAVRNHFFCEISTIESTDKDGIAIIMCEPQLVGKYQALTQGKTILESSLHQNMLEHLNSEIALGTITSISAAKYWLRGSFLYQRLQRNPKKLDEIVIRNVAQLEKTGLIRRSTFEHKEILESTEYGDIMSKDVVGGHSWRRGVRSPRRRPSNDTLWSFTGSLLSGSELLVYNELRTHNDIRYTLSKVDKTRDKVFLLLQVVLGNISLNSPEMKKGDSQPQLDAFTVFTHAPRLARVVVEIAVTRKLGTQLMYGLEAFRCLTAKTWEERPTVLRQIEQIGEKSLKVLVEHGITTLGHLRQQTPARLEILLNRRSPFGHDILASVTDIPKYELVVTQVSATSDRGKSPIQFEIAIGCSLANRASFTKPKKKRRYHDMTTILTVTSDYNLVDFRRTPTKSLKETKTFKVIAQLTRPSQSIVVLIASESFAGNTIKRTIKPDIPPNEYPTLNTRPISSLALDLDEFENDPKFWDVRFDDTSDPAITANDIKKGRQLTKPCSESSQSPTRLPNGNYGRNHTCADKSKCLHPCCREEKSQPRSKRGEDKRKRQKMVDDSGMSKLAVPHSATEGVISSLERLHNQPDIQSSLEIKQDKLEFGPIANRATQERKARPTFEIKFTEVELGSNSPCMALNEPFDDALPTIEELLSGSKSDKNLDQSICPSTPPELVEEGHHFSIIPDIEEPRKRPRMHSTESMVGQPLFLLSDDPDMHMSSQTMTSTEFQVFDILSCEGSVPGPNFSVTETSLTEEVRSYTWDKDRDEFADLDEWLNSSFVETD